MVLAKRPLHQKFFITNGCISLKINASRIAQRVMKGVHDVPITKVISRFYKSLINCNKVSAFVDRTYIYDNSRSQTSLPHDRWQNRKTIRRATPQKG